MADKEKRGVISRVRDKVSGASIQAEHNEKINNIRASMYLRSALQNVVDSTEVDAELATYKKVIERLSPDSRKKWDSMFARVEHVSQEMEAAQNLPKNERAFIVHQVARRMLPHAVKTEFDILYTQTAHPSTAMDDAKAAPHTTARKQR